MVDEDSHLKFFSLSLQNKDKGLLFLKGGREKDETIEKAAQCETVEETGVRGEVDRCQNCSKLESLPEEIGDLENLKDLYAGNALISWPLPSFVRLNKLKFLTFSKYSSGDGEFFVFPQVNEGLRSLEILDLCYCNIIDGGLPQDIGCLHSLKVLNLRGNNFEHLPRSIAQLGALRSMDLSGCKRLTQLPEFPQQLDIIHADWSNDSICSSLFQNISSLNHDIYASDSLSLRVFTSFGMNIPSWFRHRGSVSVNLPENWYVCDNFLGFAVCYDGEHPSICTTLRFQLPPFPSHLEYKY